MSRLLLSLLVSSCYVGSVGASLSEAQIVPDNTLPNNSLVTSKGKIAEINGGTTVGTNLFHSFEQFSISAGAEAFFNNATKTENIISRVTGQSVSNIDGSIRANGQANLFLLNPNGIIFGPNASLNIGGSFIASTASSLRFDDGSVFSSEPSTSTLLTISTPIGLQMGASPGNIVNRGARLEVLPNKTLALVGGNIAIEGGSLTASQGRIELGSVGYKSFIGLTPAASGWRFNYQGVERFENIELTQSATVNVSGNGSGDVQMQANNIAFRNGSSIQAQTQGNEDGGMVRLGAFESIAIVGTNVIGFPSAIAIFTGNSATGNGGHLAIATKRLLVSDGALILNSTSGAANAGNIDINAQDINVRGFGIVNLPLFPRSSSILTVVLPGASGNAGNITINTNNLFLADTGQIGTFVSNGAIGKGGNLTVAAQRLFVASGARIGSTTSGAGNGGNVRIVADEITVTGRIPQTPSAITTVVDLTGTGRGGDLKVETDRLQVLDGAAISAGTFGIGDSGNLTITAKEEIAIADGISFIGTTVFSTSLIPPELLPRDLTSANIGRGGDLTVETKRLQITNGGLMGTGTLGVGDSGDLLVRASESIEISGVRNTPGGLFSSRIFSSAEDGSTGNGGNLTIETPTLRIFDGGQVRSSTNGVGKAGNIRIDTRSLELFGISGEGELPSSIDAASTSNGMAGSIAIDTTDLTVRDGAEISVSGRMGGAGNLVINADRILLDNEAKLSAEVAGGDRGNININSDLLLLRRGSQITTNALGDSSGGNIAIDTNFLIALPQENSDITANAQQSFGGRATISATGIFGIVSRQRLTPLSDITASSDLGTEFSGTVEIINPNVVSTSATVKLPSEIVEMSDRIVASCPADKGNTFVVSGRGGIPENPTQSLRGQSVWQDWRSLSEYEYKSEFSSSSPRTPAPAQIVEAQGWILNNNGKVQLIAQNSAANPQGFWKQTPNCNKY